MTILLAPLMGTGLVATAVKTGAYTAAANDLVRVDSTSAPFAITLPASPADGDVIGFFDVSGACASKYVSVDADSGTTVELVAGTSLRNANECLILIYRLSTTNWQIIDNVFGLTKYGPVLSAFFGSLNPAVVTLASITATVIVDIQSIGVTLSLDPAIVVSSIAANLAAIDNQSIPQTFSLDSAVVTQSVTATSP